MVFSEGDLLGYIFVLQDTATGELKTVEQVSPLDIVEEAIGSSMVQTWIALATGLRPDTAAYIAEVRVHRVEAAPGE